MSLSTRRITPESVPIAIETSGPANKLVYWTSAIGQVDEAPQQAPQVAQCLPQKRSYRALFDDNDHYDSEEEEEENSSDDDDDDEESSSEDGYDDRLVGGCGCQCNQCSHLCRGGCCSWCAKGPQ